MNPVLFDEHQAVDDLTVYSRQLSEFGWKDRLVGLIDSGFLYVDVRVPKNGFYEFHAKVLPWNEIHEVSTRRSISVRGILLGTCSILFATITFMAGWIYKTHTGPGVVVIPLVCGVCGVILLLGATRNRIVVRTRTRTFEWTSAPLAYEKTLSICREAGAKAREHHVQWVETHT